MAEVHCLVPAFIWSNQRQCSRSPFCAIERWARISFETLFCDV